MPTPSPYPLVKLKTDVNEDFARTSSTGNASAPSLQSDEGRSPMCDLHGRLVVVDYNTTPAGSGLLLQYSSAALIEKAQIVVAGVNHSSYLKLLYGYNNINNLIYLQLFNVAVAPAPGAIPINSILVPPFANFSLGPAGIGWKYPLGIYFASSSTPDTYTPTGTNNLWVNAQYMVLPN